MSRLFLLRRVRRAVWLLLAIVLLAGAYDCFPSLRLMLQSRQLRTVSTVQRVDAHRYDQEWFDAARVGRIDILRVLHEAHYPIDSQNGSGYSAVILAAYDEQPDALDYLLRNGADACRGDRNGNTALMGALYKGNLTIARRLLAAKCPIDQTNHSGETALSFAALFGRLEVFHELISRGADPNHVDARGDSLLAISLKQGNDASARALRSVGAVR
jgi:ankyrin repeat protein